MKACGKRVTQDIHTNSTSVSGLGKWQHVSLLCFYIQSKTAKAKVQRKRFLGKRFCTTTHITCVQN